MQQEKYNKQEKNMITAEEAAAYLKAKKQGNRWIAKCPAHDDKHESLSIGEGIDENGERKLLLYCHAGCDFNSIINKLPKKTSSNINMTNEQAIPPSQILKNTSQEKPKLKRIYDYVDEHGEIKYQVLRYEPKTFKQRRTAASGFIWGLGDIQRYPYRLTEVIKSETVVIVEGEDDANALAKLEFCTTTFSGGAGKFRDEYLQWFEGKKVYIIPDNDEAGVKGANIIADKLQGTSKEIKFINWHDKPRKYDVSDWINEGGTAEQFQELINNATDRCEYNDGATVSEIKTPLTDWREQLITKKDKSGSLVVQNRIHNVSVYLRHHPELTGCFAMNQFSYEIDIVGKLPWYDGVARQITDSDDVKLTAWMECHDVTMAVPTVHRALISVADENKYNPLHEYLNGIKWDGEKRVDNMLITHGGAEDNTYTRTVVRKFLIGAVARAMNPGCKMDNMIVLEGEQGIGKSTFLRALFGDEYFSDTMPDFSNFKDAMQFLRGVWCVEIAELDSFNKTDVNTIKRFLTVQHDRYRPSYGINNISVGRSCVFAGTVNPVGGYLKDPTGERRFWPLEVKNIDVEWVKRNRDQIWAEVMMAFKAGETHTLTTAETELAVVEQEKRREVDAIEDRIKSFVSTRDGFTLYECITDFNGLGWPSERITRSAQLRVSAILKKLGYWRHQEGIGKNRRWVYRLMKVKQVQAQKKTTDESKDYNW